MSLTLDQVEHIADLARLNLTNIEKARYLEQLSAILYFLGIESLATDHCGQLLRYLISLGRWSIRQSYPPTSLLEYS